MIITNFLYKGIRKVVAILRTIVTNIFSKLILKLNRVRFGSNLISNGIPIVNVKTNASFDIGNNFRMNNGKHYNLIGRQQKCMFLVEGRLVIENNVGMSATAIVCHNSITIEDNVKLGGNVIIYDTDFHSLDFMERCAIPEITEKVQTKPVRLCKNVFIGAHSLILKGVTIGENSIVGAGSVVTKNIPSNEIWGGNPAKLIRKI